MLYVPVIPKKSHPENDSNQQPQLLNHLVRSSATQEAVLLPLEAAQRFTELMFDDSTQQRSHICVYLGVCTRVCLCAKWCRFKPELFACKNKSLSHSLNVWIQTGRVTSCSLYLDSNNLLVTVCCIGYSFLPYISRHVNLIAKLICC